MSTLEKKEKRKKDVSFKTAFVCSPSLLNWEQTATIRLHQPLHLYNHKDKKQSILALITVNCLCCCTKEASCCASAFTRRPVLHLVVWIALFKIGKFCVSIFLGWWHHWSQNIIGKTFDALFESTIEACNETEALHRGLICQGHTCHSSDTLPCRELLVGKINQRKLIS